MRVGWFQQYLVECMIQHSLRRVAVDSSSIILLQKASLLDRFLRSYTVVIAESVFLELVLPGKKGAGELEMLLAGRQKSLLKPCDLRGMGRGESASICLYLEGRADFILLDDKRAATFCRSNDIPFVNSLLLCRILFEAGEIDQKTHGQIWQRLIRDGYYSKAIVKQAMNIGESSLKVFYPR